MFVVPLRPQDAEALSTMGRLQVPTQDRTTPEPSGATIPKQRAPGGLRRRLSWRAPAS